MSFYYLNRTICDVLEEMRKLDQTKNYSSLLALIEEAQSMANRMESKLHDISDLDEVTEELKEKRKQLKKLRKQINKLEDEET